MNNFTITGNIVNILDQSMLPGRMTINEGIITSITQEKNAKYPNYIIPGFVDAYFQIDKDFSPSEFVRLATIHGSVGVLCDPTQLIRSHGVKGLEELIEKTFHEPFHFAFGAPSILDEQTIHKLFESQKCTHLTVISEVKEVLACNKIVLNKIEIAKKFQRPVDGYAPGLRGRELDMYTRIGIHSDRSSLSLSEALDKINCELRIIIEEGPNAKQFDILYPLISLHMRRTFFSTGGLPYSELIKGHINNFIRKAVALQYEPMDVLACACSNPVLHYGLDIGLLQEGDSADFIIIDNIKDLNVLKTYIKGQLVYEKSSK